jgi:tripartite-type tricarboxylate transporter receptor subunit TctC
VKLIGCDDREESMSLFSARRDFPDILQLIVSAVSRATRGLIAAGVAFGAMSGVCVAQSDNYPSRSVRMIVPFAAGGPTDLGARLVADYLSKLWGQSVVVESRPGGGTVIGTVAVAQAPADGYTLLFGPSSALVENSVLMRDLPYDPIKSFAPVTEIYEISAGLSVNGKLPAKDLKELVALARSKSLSYSSFGIGTGPYLLMETFKKAASIDILHVPYKGNAPGLAAVVTGEVDMTGAGLGTITPHVQSGAIRLLAAGGDEQSKFAPGVPTFKELGYANVGAGSQFIGLWAPPGTPPAVIAKINKDVVAALNTPQFAKFLDTYAYDKGSATTPDDLAKLTKASIEFWKPVITSLGIKLEN